MRTDRLFEKLRLWEETRVGRSDERCGLDSILSHLRRLLNTRQGNVPIAADYGVPDFLSMLQSFPESVVSMEGALRATIERYEPRLKDVQVLFVPDQEETLNLRFQITGEVVGDPRQRLSFESSIDLYGKVRICGDARRSESAEGQTEASNDR